MVTGLAAFLHLRFWPKKILKRKLSRPWPDLDDLGKKEGGGANWKREKTSIGAISSNIFLYSPQHSNRICMNDQYSLTWSYLVWFYKRESTKTCKLHVKRYEWMNPRSQWSQNILDVVITSFLYFTEPVNKEKEKLVKIFTNNGRRVAEICSARKSTHSRPPPKPTTVLNNEKRLKNTRSSFKESYIGISVDRIIKFK